MKFDLEVRLAHDGDKWIAYHPDFEACGQSLAELDQDLTRCLLDRQLFPENSHVTIFMAFDHNCIPTWIRQYAYHYFNRHIRLNLKSASLKTQ
ncbi:DUF5395 domain-containing protein [Nitrosomonas halophila]|uniref:Uncharacterized protein n=1 Tax=Nitrosomonas halophila TaxID=44576 RepID=A0A1H3D8C3_9PROT|nr:DUF5395 domain-containing protein [Nitrosomonas halophila]SDX62651.1 hypothetical protein SAMN05421881_100482 [Nitrosomonas halophila]